MDNFSFNRFLYSMNLVRYKIQYHRVEGKPFVYVKTDGLNAMGMREVFTVSKSPSLEDAEILLKRIVKRILETDDRVGVRKDLINHPLTNKPLRYLVKLSEELDRTLLVVGPDENNNLPGEKGYKHFI